ncbi:MAG: hypothetical protein D6675_04665 [Gemmatimonadetes bacterium]|nr:MAG: hypothetical protein D6675_04665 [Gemmatimonadota bacterium]
MSRKSGKSQFFAGDQYDEDEFIRVNFTLQNRQIDFLSDFCYNVRKETRYKLNRSETIRACIEVIQEKVDEGSLKFEDVRSFEDLKNLLHGHF